ncbi:AzlC family ABC transporter permease [Sporomusa sphaeroides DSM 2875]|jgi:predicted branched-subunit amino acid permease|uniref:AzlC family ABC transporter permease n=1 Tax=Sporomusa sphaeroides TaxID=47679 RepID=UPI00202DE9F7|nr:AzlC family ABC transporter permease [Sporomusa sphaeroides]MCM0759672.1 AzlC family ABC transporter permease [Sporomusa sphaeroides DSM 2875]
METNRIHWKNGFRDGIPIALGYFAVSFTFGLLAKKAGLTPFQAVAISLTNLTSAGQFAALGLMGASATYLEMASTQLILNLRYCLMSCALSQKLDSKVPFWHRFLLAHGVTDEIFGVAVCKSGKLNPFYQYGLMSSAIPGWTLGTFFGVISGDVLPERIISALSIALYGMFIAVIIPPAKSNRILTGIILLSMLTSLFFTKLVVFQYVSPGFKIILLTILIAGMAAFLFPMQGEAESCPAEGKSIAPALREGGLP